MVQHFNVPVTAGGGGWAAAFAAGSGGVPGAPPAIARAPGQGPRVSVHFPAGPVMDPDGPPGGERAECRSAPEGDARGETCGAGENPLPAYAAHGRNS